jgi:hypothetical protein
MRDLAGIVVPSVFRFVVFLCLLDCILLAWYYKYSSRWSYYGFPEHFCAYICSIIVTFWWFDLNNIEIRSFVMLRKSCGTFRHHINPASLNIHCIVFKKFITYNISFKNQRSFTKTAGIASCNLFTVHIYIEVLRLSLFIIVFKLPWFWFFPSWEQIRVSMSVMRFLLILVPFEAL